MTAIKPFKAVHYNSERVKDLSKVVCPPYDVISPKQQTQYYSASEHNFIRVLLGKDQEDDNGRDNKYLRAKSTFEQWLKEEILSEDGQQGIYFYRQEYKIMGSRHSRLGFISLMKLQDEQDSKIHPHENTHMSAKEDRLRLWKTVQASLSPIFVCFSDKGKKVEKVFQQNVAQTVPMMNITDEDGVKHILWRLTDPDLIKEIQDSVADQRLFIADGHHRYEVAKEYRRIKSANRGADSDKTMPYDYVMTYLTNMDSRDLQIFPIHRIIKRLPKDLDFLEDFFRIDKITSRDDVIITLAKAGQNEHAFVLYTGDGYKLLRLKNKLLIDKHVTEGSKDFRELDATILKTLVLDRIGIVSDDIIYSKDFNEVTEMVDQGKASAGFIMNPVRMQQLKNIAFCGERMPPKTTYFYPKVLSGLTAYRLG